jgi:hypothetical protein
MINLNLIKTKKNVMRLFGVLLVSTFLVACGEQAQEPAVQEPTAQEPVAQEQTADEILAAVDTSDWKVRPEDYGFTVQEYLHAEHDLFMSNMLGRGAGNNFFHFTELVDKDDTWVVSPALDHLYSVFVIDTREGVSITLPDVGDRFLSLHLQDANHIFVAYLFDAGGRTVHFEAEDFDTPFVIGGVRTGTIGTPEDIRHIVEELQPQYKIEAGSNDFSSIEAPDVEEVLKLRAALVAEYDKLPDTYGTVSYDIRDVTDWEKKIYTIAGAWGLSPEDTAMYPAYALPGAKGNQCYEGSYPPIPSREYFSITVYGQDKYLMSNEHNVVSSRRPNFKGNTDGSFSVVYGGMDCKEIADERGVNFLYTPEDNWSFLMRNYAPEVEAMKRYEMPEIKPVAD